MNRAIANLIANLLIKKLGLKGISSKDIVSILINTDRSKNYISNVVYEIAKKSGIDVRNSRSLDSISNIIMDNIGLKENLIPTFENYEIK